MSSRFAQIIKQAKFTCDPKNKPSFAANFGKLKQLVDKLTASDLNIDKKVLDKKPFIPYSKNAPCTYIHLFENENVIITVFVLSPEYTMPCHDHPEMYGLLKTIHGRVNIQSYTTSPDQRFNDLIQEHYCQEKKRVIVPVNKEIPIELVVDSPSTVLTPQSNNFHEIMAVDGPCAFFDILSPPFESNKIESSFYKKVKISQNINKDQVFLERIPGPDNYYCDAADYELPEFIHSEMT